MLIRVENGKVLDLYTGLDEATIEQLKAAFTDSEFIETPEPVNRGDEWPKARSQPTEPLPQAKTRDSVVMELNEIVEHKKREYLQRWPSASQADLWPMFNDEIVKLKKSELAVSASLYPALAGALSVSSGISVDKLSAEQITEFVDIILGAKTAHAIELAKLEKAYQLTLMGWLSNPEIVITEAFEASYGT